MLTSFQEQGGKALDQIMFSTDDAVAIGQESIPGKKKKDPSEVARFNLPLYVFSFLGHFSDSFLLDGLLYRNRAERRCGFQGENLAERVNFKDVTHSWNSNVQTEESQASSKIGAVYKNSCLFRAETKEVQLFWASQIQMAILQSRPITPKGYEAYGAYFKVESAIERVKESLGIRNRKYKVQPCSNQISKML